MSPRWRRLFSAVLVLSVLFVCHEADAKRRRGMVRAKRIHKKATNLYNLGKFEEALKEFSRAYKISSHPGFLFNIGQCHRQVGRRERALFFFRAALREQPQGRMAEFVGKLIGEIEAEIRAEKEKALAAEKEAQRRAQEQRLAAEAQRQKTLAEAQERAAAQATNGRGVDELDLNAPEVIVASGGNVAMTAPQVAAVVEDAAIYERWWFWTALVGAAAVAAGTTVVLTQNTSGGALASRVPDSSLGFVDAR